MFISLRVFGAVAAGGCHRHRHGNGEMRCANIGICTGGWPVIQGDDKSQALQLER
jgi:hypothetical protein